MIRTQLCLQLSRIQTRFLIADSFSFSAPPQVLLDSGLSSLQETHTKHQLSVPEYSREGGGHQNAKEKQATFQISSMESQRGAKPRPRAEFGKELCEVKLAE